MKIVKAALLILVFCIFGLCSYAQPGVRAGIHLSCVEGFNGSAPSHGFSWQPGFRAEAFYDIRVAGDFFIQPALAFATIGLKNSLHTGSEKIVQQMIPQYLEIPVTVLYKHSMGTGNLIAGAGIYLAYGIGGTWNHSGLCAW